MNELKTPNPKYERLNFASFIGPLYEDLKDMHDSLISIAGDIGIGEIPVSFNKKAILNLKSINYKEVTEDVGFGIQFANTPSSNNHSTAKPTNYRIHYNKGTKIWITKTRYPEFIELKSVIIPPKYVDDDGITRDCKVLGLGRMVIPLEYLQENEVLDKENDGYLPIVEHYDINNADVEKQYSKHPLFHPYGVLYNSNVMHLHTRTQFTREEYQNIVLKNSSWGWWGYLYCGDLPLFAIMDSDRMGKEYGTLSMPVSGDMLMYRYSTIQVLYDDDGNYKELKEMEMTSKGRPYYIYSAPYNYNGAIENYNYRYELSIRDPESGSSINSRFSNYPQTKIKRHTICNAIRNGIDIVGYSIDELLGYVTNDVYGKEMRYVGFSKTKKTNAFNFFRGMVPTSVVSPKIVLNAFCAVQ